MPRSATFASHTASSRSVVGRPGRCSGVTRVDQPGLQPVGLQHIERRLPVVAGCLHHHPGHAQPTQPVGHAKQRAGHRRGGPHSCARLPDPCAPGTRTQQTSSALPISGAATRPISSSVSCVSSSTRPPSSPTRHQHGRPREPQDRAEANPRARATLKGPQRGSQRPRSLRPQRPRTHGVSGQPRPIFTPERASPQGDRRLASG